MVTILFYGCSGSQKLSLDNGELVEIIEVEQNQSEIEAAATNEGSEPTPIIAKRDPESAEYQEYKDLSNTVTNYYVLAQQYYYAAKFKTALYFIQKAAEFRFDETADILALTGSIYLELDEYELFLYNWKKALEIDPEVPITLSPRVKRLLTEEGLIK